MAAAGEVALLPAASAAAAVAGWGWQLPLAIAAGASAGLLRLRDWWCNAVLGPLVRPERCDYSDAQLGPEMFSVDGHPYRRTDGAFTNDRGQQLKYSWWQPLEPAAQRTPCVIYLHTNSGARVEALSVCPAVLPRGMTVFSFDFSGCGHSEGDLVSLGHYEQHDVAAAVEHVLGSGTVSGVGLWGRSLGAVSAVAYAARDTSVGCVVSDSGFSSLPRLLDEMLQSWLPRLPAAARSQGIAAVRRACADKAGFDIGALDTASHAARICCPGLIVHGREDTVVQPEHALHLHAAWGSGSTAGRRACSLLEFDGDHNSVREEHVVEAAAEYLARMLQPPGELPRPAPPSETAGELLVPPASPPAPEPTRRPAGRTYRRTAKRSGQKHGSKRHGTRRRSSPPDEPDDAAAESGAAVEVIGPAATAPPAAAGPSAGADDTFDEAAFQRVIAGRGAPGDIAALGEAGSPVGQRASPPAGQTVLVADLMLNLSACYLRQQDTRAALQMAAAAASIDGWAEAVRPKPHYRMALAFEALSQPASAAACAQHAVRLGAGGEARAVLKRLHVPPPDEYDPASLALEIDRAAQPLQLPATGDAAEPLQLKAQGNSLFKLSRVEEAAVCYLAALRAAQDGTADALAAAASQQMDAAETGDRRAAAVASGLALAALALDWGNASAADIRTRASALLSA